MDQGGAQKSLAEIQAEEQRQERDRQERERREKKARQKGKKIEFISFSTQIENFRLPFRLNFVYTIIRLSVSVLSLFLA